MLTTIGSLEEIELPEAPDGDAVSLGQTLGLSPTVAHWLKSRGMTGRAEVERFLGPKLAHLTPPDQMADRSAAAKRLARAVRNKEHVCVFGDYDCDGITATAIITEVVRALGGRITPLLASRFDGGYGVSSAAVSRIIDSGATLLVTCDCGSSDHDNLETLNQAGLEVVVIDHHLVPARPLPALAFLNPHRSDCGFPFKGLASCGLALSVAAALRTELGVALDLRQWLDLVAIGTIADVAPLVGDNRALVRVGLASLSQGDRPGVRTLLDFAKHQPGELLSAEDVAFRIAPRLNAPGRLGSPDLALELLLSRDAASATELGARIEALQLKRREVQDQIIEEAGEEILREGYANRPAIVVGRESWNHGIVGIAAGRLAERFGKPVIVIGFDGSHGRGSVRGPRGARLFDALEQNAAILERFGGHQAAAGLEVSRENLGALREGFEAACSTGELNRAALPWAAQLLRLHPNDDLWQVLEDLTRLEPCGEGNPAPRLALDAEVVEARAVRGGHLKMELSVAGNKLGCFGINMGELIGALGERITVIGTLRRDRWRGGRALEVRAESLLK